MSITQAGKRRERKTIMNDEEPKLIISNAEEFKTSEGEYEFPFIVLDPTPGGTNLGRIEWVLEPIFKRGKIVKMFLQSRQTRDERYLNTLFELTVNSPFIFASSLDDNSFLTNVWRLGYCAEHKTTQLWAYPKNHHSILSIERHSSFGLRVEFK